MKFLKPIALNNISVYIDNIKKWAYEDIAHVQNNVLNKNPYTSEFIHKCCLNKKIEKANILFIFKRILYFYVKSLVNFLFYFYNYLVFILFGKKSSVDFNKKQYVIDIFFLGEKIIKDGKFDDGYFPGLYKILDDHKKNYVFLPRLTGVERSFLKFKKILRILNKDKKNIFILEYELLSVLDMLKILIFIINYPIKQFKLIQKESNKVDIHFNYELFNSLPNTSFEAYARYLTGKKISKKLSKGSKIISWQEFQNQEKAFNKAIKESNKNIIIIGCELLIKYEAYLSMHITDIDTDLMITPHKTLLNGMHNYSDSGKHNFEYGVSFRYQNIFKFHLELNPKDNGVDSWL